MRKIFVAALMAVGTVGLIGQAQEPGSAKPIRALLVIGGCCHDYSKQKDILADGIKARANVAVTISYDPDKGTKHLNPIYQSPEWAKNFDVIIHDECSSEVNDKQVVDRILDPHREGLPAVLLHCGMHCYRVPKSDEWFKFTGLSTKSHGAQKPIQVTFDKSSPITKNLQDWTTINEELYKEDKLYSTATSLAKGVQGKDNYVCVWTNMYNDKARVFSTTLGHNNQTVADPRYLDLVTNGLLWATGHLTDAGTPAPGFGPKK